MAPGRRPGPALPRHGRVAALRERYFDWLVLAAARRPVVTRARIDACTLSEPLWTLVLSPRAVPGPGRPPTTDVPLTEAESRAVAPPPHRPSEED
ncbi:hypothetical protein [Saccharothrix saharensis]|uniref:hypothetical protein n=1 Tax=Saccharothrix saharensis TaxID=571190 RepID=UPI00114E585C|nr:hypothetical protein [Saccharothrix saharensis]